VLFVDDFGYGLLRAAPAVGALLTGFVMAGKPPRLGAGRKLLYAVAGFGICTLIFAVSSNFWLSLLALAGTGAFDNVSMVIRGSIVPLFTPEEMRGRVSSVNGLFIGSSNELGAFESGVAAWAVGLVPSVVIGGFMTLLVVSITWLKAPKLRDMDLPN
jgi:MFS family permease